MTKTAKHRPDKIRKIVEISEKLFLKKGYEATTIDDILAATGLSKGGFYHYFTSKDDVLAESVKTIMKDMLAELEPIINDDKFSAMEKLKHFMAKKAGFQQSRKEFAKYLSMLMQSDFMLYKYYTSLAQSYVDPLAKIIEQGAKEGVFSVQYPRATADILLRAAASFPQSALLGEYLLDANQHQQYSISLKQVIARTLGIDSKELDL
jgi:AcrR family transcriptional regulator